MIMYKNLSISYIVILHTFITTECKPGTVYLNERYFMIAMTDKKLYITSHYHS